MKMVNAGASSPAWETANSALIPGIVLFGGAQLFCTPRWSQLHARGDIYGLLVHMALEKKKWNTAPSVRENSGNNVRKLSISFFFNNLIFFKEIYFSYTLSAGAAWRLEASESTLCTDAYWKAWTALCGVVGQGGMYRLGVSSPRASVE